MKFWKYHGLGNDFVFIEDFEENLIGKAPELAKKLCDRNYGIGGDGLVLITKPKHYTMRIFNADGSEAEMCGNAIRCIAKHLKDRGLESEDQMIIGTLKGEKKITVTGEQYTVDMGEPVFDPAQIPMAVDKTPLNAPILVDGRHFLISGVSMGNPHGVIFVSDLAEVDLPLLGPKIEHHSVWPAQANIEFVSVLGKDHIEVKVWERGVGPTLACGTGACASAVVASSLQLTSREVRVTLPGGDLVIKWQENNRVLMTGPATLAFEGTVSI